MKNLYYCAAEDCGYFQGRTDLCPFCNRRGTKVKEDLETQHFICGSPKGKIKSAKWGAKGFEAHMAMIPCMPTVSKLYYDVRSDPSLVTCKLCKQSPEWREANGS